MRSRGRLTRKDNGRILVVIGLLLVFALAPQFRNQAPIEIAARGPALLPPQWWFGGTLLLGVAVVAFGLWSLWPTIRRWLRR